MSDLERILTEIQQAEARGQGLELARACSRAGQIYLERSLYQDAVRLYQKASQAYGEQGQAESQTRTLNQLGVCQIMEGKPLEALETLQEAVARARSLQIPDPGLEAAVQGNLGLAHASLQDFRAAFKAHKAALEAAEEIGDQALRLNALINLADARLQDSRFQSAQGFALVALDLARELQPHPGIVVIHDLLGMISSRQGDLRSAIEHHQQAYQSALDFGDLHRQGIALANQALAYEGLTEMKRARETMEAAQEIFIRSHSDYQHKTARDLERIRKASGG